MDRHHSHSSSKSTFDDEYRSSDETKATAITRPSNDSNRPALCEEPDSYFEEQPETPQQHRRPYDRTESVDRPPLPRSQTSGVALRNNDDLASGFSIDPRASDSTYASTDLSDDADEEEDRDRYDAEVMNDDDYRFSDEYFEPTADPCSPKQFSQLFPSARQLMIRHDDQSRDGNMNLRVDTRWDHMDEETGRHETDVLTLYHLKMNDLRTADFSLRRYCRESGREICHYKRVIDSEKKKKKKKSKMMTRNPPFQISRPGSGLQRSVSNVFSTLRRGVSGSSSKSDRERHDSGYGSSSDNEGDDAPTATRSSATATRSSARPTPQMKTFQPPNTPPVRPGGEVKLEFSNYQHLDVKRHSNSSDSKRRYSFEQWGSSFYWRRSLSTNRHLDNREEVSFHLIDASRQGSQGKGVVVAKLTPQDLSLEEYYDDLDNQGWVQASVLQILDRSLIEQSRSGNSGLGDVVVATGLLALVDDALIRRWHAKERSPRVHYMPGLKKAGVQYELVNPKRFIEEVFGKREGGERERFVEHQREMQKAGPNGLAMAARAILGGKGRSSLEQGRFVNEKEKGVMERRVTEEISVKGRGRSRLSEEYDGRDGGKDHRGMDRDRERASREKAFIVRPTHLRKGQTYMY